MPHTGFEPVFLAREANVLDRTTLMGLNIIALRGFEPLSRDPESRMLDHYTTGLYKESYTKRNLKYFRF